MRFCSDKNLAFVIKIRVPLTRSLSSETKMLNKQIPIKQDLSHGGNTLLINSIFYTIQGEGPFAGTPAVFIRLAGCNLQCPACDTEYTENEVLNIAEIMEMVAETIPETNRFQAPLVVITGGEPFRQPISKLIGHLLDAMFQVQVETNGTLFVDLDWSFVHRNFTIVCSPKAGKVNDKLWPHIKALKYVLHADEINPEDGLPIYALKHSASPQVARPPEHWKGEIYVQPIDEQDIVENLRHQKAAVESAMKFGYRLCLQIHKVIGVA